MGSILGNLGKKIKRLFAGGSSLIFGVGSKAAYTDIDTEKAITEGFDSNTAVYSIAMRDAQKFSSIPRYVYDSKVMEEKAYNERAVIQNDLSKLLNRPNPGEGQDTFLTKVRLSYKICGEAFIWLNRGDVSQRWDENEQVLVDRTSEEYVKMPVLEMYVIPADKMILRPDPDNIWGVTGYYFEVGGKLWPIRKEDVIHWKLPSMSFDDETRSHLRGKSPLSAGYKSLQQNNSATDASVRMYQNDGSKGFAFNKTMGVMSPQQESQARNIIDAKINNNDVKGQVAMLQGDWGYVALNGSVDLNLLEAKKLTWKELCFLLTVPYTQFDPDTNFSNTEWQQKNWITNVIIPDSKSLDGELNRVLLQAFGLENIAFIGCDTSELPELQDDLSKLTAALAQAWWLSPNEKRKIQNEEPINDPILDELWIPPGIQPMSQLNDAAEMAKLEMELRNDGGRDKEKDI